jgi:hypothetical protein
MGNLGSEKELAGLNLAKASLCRSRQLSEEGSAFL